MRVSRERRGRVGRQHILLVLALLVMLGMAASALAPAAIAQPRRDRDVNAEIVGGAAVPEGRYPFLTLIQVSENGRPRFQCGGSLIAASFVLTAAHCTEDDNGQPFAPGQFVVAVGKAEVFTSGAKNIRDVVAVSQHPDWNPSTFTNDVAVLELDRPIARSVAAPVHLVAAGDGAFDRFGTAATVAGWGATRAGGGPVAKLRAVDVGVLRDSVCNDAYDSGANPYTATVMLCAAAKGKDSCQGDSGGPLFVKERIGTRKVKTKNHGKKSVPVFRDVQIGTVSFGILCGDPRFPGVYTRLSAPSLNNFVNGVVNGGG